MRCHHVTIDADCGVLRGIRLRLCGLLCDKLVHLKKNNTGVNTEVNVFFQVILIVYLRI